MTNWLAIENGVVIPVTSERRIIRSGYVLVEGGRIAEVGEGPAPERPGLDRIDANGGIILPGLIDTHAHAGHAMVKNLGTGTASWMDVTGSIYAQSTDAEFWRAEAALSALERLQCGTTTSVLMMGGGADVVKTDTPESTLAHLDGVRSVGVAELLAIGANRPTGPRLYRDWTGGAPRERRTTPLEQLAVARALIAGHNAGPQGLHRLAVSLPVFSALELAGDAPDGAAELSRQTLKLAAESGCLLVQDGHREGTMAAAAARVGLGGPKAVFAHSIDLTDADIEALRASGAGVAHNPAALMAVVGRCPATELAQMGVPVGLGSDAPAPDRSFDMFRVMFQAHRYHARHFRDASVLPPWQLVEMATIGGARALGLDAEIGSLEPGKRADVIVVDWRKPHLWPPACPVDRLARFASGADVDTVMVAGRVLMRGRKVLSANPDRILDDATHAYGRMVERAGLGPDFALYPTH